MNFFNFTKNAIATLDLVLSLEFKIPSTNESAKEASMTLGFVIKVRLPWRSISETALSNLELFSPLTNINATQITYSGMILTVWF